MSQRDALSRFYPVPIGTIVPVIGNYTQYNDGYIICNGISVSRTTWSLLFNVIGTQFGAGDGVTTFNVPNLQVQVPFGATSNGGFNPSSITGTQTYQLTETNMPTLGLSTSNFVFGGGTLQRDSIYFGVNSYKPDGGTETVILKDQLDSHTDVNVSLTSIDVSYTGSGTAQTNPITGSYIPPNYGMIYLIKGKPTLET